MQFKSSIATLLAAAAVGASAQDAPATGKLGDALTVSNNPVGVKYIATLPETAFTKGSAYANGGNVKGYVSAMASPDGVGVVFNVHFSNLPKEGGPFKYHLHVAPVPDNGNCTATLAHLDPFLRGETPACNPSAPETCEVGDLSGKWGEVKSDPFTAMYTDKYASTLEGIGAFFGNRSFVFHYANKTRISCANFKKAENNADDDCDSSTAISSTAAVTASLPGASTLSPASTTTPSITGTGGIFPVRSSFSPPVTAGGALPRVAETAGVAALFAAIVFAI